MTQATNVARSPCRPRAALDGGPDARRGLALDPERFRPAGAEATPEQRQLGEVVDPDPLGAMRESLRGLYTLMPGHRRDVPDRKASEQWVASSVRERLRGREDYLPLGLRARTSRPAAA